MFEELKRRELIEALKSLIEKAEAETSEKDSDIYCEFMKGMILNTYSTN